MASGMLKDQRGIWGCCRCVKNWAPQQGEQCVFLLADLGPEGISQHLPGILYP